MNNGETAERASSKIIQAVVFSVFCIILLVVVCRLFAPFFTVILWAALLYIMVSPLHEKIAKKIDCSKKPFGNLKKSLLAGIFAVSTALIILLPLSFIAIQFYKQAAELIKMARDFFIAKPSFLQDAYQKISDFITDLSGNQVSISALDIQNRLANLISWGAQNLISVSSMITRNVGAFFLGFLFLIFALFFFFLDGPFLANLVIGLIPIKKDYIKVITSKFKEIAKKLILGYIVVALIQASISYIVFLLFHVRGALVFSVLTFICVFIPLLGGAIVWLPIGIVRILSGDIPGGILFILVSGVAISSLDNFIRPAILQNRIHLHPLIIFFAILGGLQSFGFNGLIMGPMVVILFLTALDLFFTEHGIERGQH